MAVDKAYVELGLDSKDFDKGLDKSERKYSDALHSMSARVVHFALRDESDLTGIERAFASLDDIAGHIGVQTGYIGAGLAAATGSATAFSQSLQRGTSFTSALSAGLGRAVAVAEALAVSAAKFWAIQKGLGLAIDRAAEANRPFLANLFSAVKTLHKYSFLINASFWVVQKAIGAVTGALRTAVNVATRLVAEVGSAASHIAGRLSPALMLGGVGGIGAAFGFAIKKAGDLEAEVSQIRKTTGLEGGPLAGLVSQVKRLAETLPGVGLDELMKITAEAGRMGIAEQGTQSVLDYVKAVGMMKVALDDIPVEESSAAIAVLLHNFQLGTNQTLGLTSALNQLDDTSNATARDILDVTTRASLAARQLGLTAAQTLALATAAKEAGVETEVAGTAISQILGKMTSNLEAFARLSGMSVDQFSATLRRDPLAALEALSRAIKATDQLKVTDALSKLGLDGQRVVQTLIALASNFDNVRAKVAVANEEFRTGASVQKEVSIQGQTTWKQLEKLWNTFSNLASEIGSVFLPAIKAAGEHLSGFMEGMEKIVSGGAFKGLESKLVGVVDILADAFERPKDGLDLLMSALELFRAQAELVANQIAAAFANQFHDAFGSIIGDVNVLKGMFFGLVSPGNIGGGVAAAAGGGGIKAAEAAVAAAQARFAKLAADMGARGNTQRLAREKQQAAELAKGPGGGGVPPPGNVNAEAQIAKDRAEARAKAEEQRRTLDDLAKQVAEAFQPGQIDAEMEGARQRIHDQLDQIKERGLFNDDDFAAARKAVEKDIDKRRKLADIANKKQEKEAEFQKDEAGLQAERQDALTQFFERLAGTSGTEIGHAGIEEFGKSVQEAVGQAPDLAKEQRDLLKKLAEIAKEEQKLSQDQAKSLDILAREAAAAEKI